MATARARVKQGMHRRAASCHTKQPEHRQRTGLRRCKTRQGWLHRSRSPWHMHLQAAIGCWLPTEAAGVAAGQLHTPPECRTRLLCPGPERSSTLQKTRDLPGPARPDPKNPAPYSLQTICASVCCSARKHAACVHTINFCHLYQWNHHHHDEGEPRVPHLILPRDKLRPRNAARNAANGAVDRPAKPVYPCVVQRQLPTGCISGTSLGVVKIWWAGREVIGQHADGR